MDLPDAAHGARPQTPPDAAPAVLRAEIRAPCRHVRTVEEDVARHLHPRRVPEDVPLEAPGAVRPHQLDQPRAGVAEVSAGRHLDDELLLIELGRVAHLDVEVVVVLVLHGQQEAADLDLEVLLAERPGLRDAVAAGGHLGVEGADERVPVGDRNGPPAVVKGDIEAGAAVLDGPAVAAGEGEGAAGVVAGRRCGAAAPALGRCVLCKE